VFDLGYLGLEKDFSGQLSSLPNRKKKAWNCHKKKKKTICNMLKRE